MREKPIGQTLVSCDEGRRRKIAEVKNINGGNHFEFHGAIVLFIPPIVIIRPGEKHRVPVSLMRAGVEYDSALINMGERGPQLVGFEKLEMGESEVNHLRRFTGFWPEHFLPRDHLIIHDAKEFYPRFAQYQATPQGKGRVLYLDPERLRA